MNNNVKELLVFPARAFSCGLLVSMLFSAQVFAQECEVIVDNIDTGKISKYISAPMQPANFKLGKFSCRVIVVDKELWRKEHGETPFSPVARCSTSEEGFSYLGGAALSPEENADDKWPQSGFFVSSKPNLWKVTWSCDVEKKAGKTRIKDLGRQE